MNSWQDLDLSKGAGRWKHWNQWEILMKKLSQMSGRSELAKQNMARGDKALCLVHTLKQGYDLSQEQLARYSGELAEIEAANEQCMDCNGKDCAHKPEWRQLIVLVVNTQ